VNGMPRGDKPCDAKVHSASRVGRTSESGGHEPRSSTVFPHVLQLLLGNPTSEKPEEEVLRGGEIELATLHFRTVASGSGVESAMLLRPS